MSRVLAVTMGEPAGIGGEITLRAWQALHQAPHPFFVIDDPRRLRRLAEHLRLTAPIEPIATPADAAAVFVRALPVLPIGVSVDATLGQLDSRNAAAVVASIKQAVALAKAGAVTGLVTNPIHKSALYSAGFGYPGHTEFLAALDGGAHEPVMMLANTELRVVPVTIHVALRQAIDQLSSDLIVARTLATAKALTADFGITAPRLAILGLNPHAGEGGSMGREEIEIIQPAIDILRGKGLAVVGPLPPDTAFAAHLRPTYDAAICMYHDQALIPLKTLDMHGGVNVTLGLSFVRTSPDHGTALDLAGRSMADADIARRGSLGADDARRGADPGSLMAAIRMAIDIAAHRARPKFPRPT